MHLRMTQDMAVKSKPCHFYWISSENTLHDSIEFRVQVACLQQIY